MNMNLLQEYVREIFLLTEALAKSSYKIVADEMQGESSGLMRANQSQGNVKHYAPPHSRLSLTDAGKEYFEQMLADVQQKGGPKSIYGDEELRDNYIDAMRNVLEGPTLNIGNDLVGSAGTYSTGGFPAMQVTVTRPGEEPVTVPVVVTWASKRTALGSVYQDSTAALISDGLLEQGYTNVGITTARKGSQLPDITVTATSPSGEVIEFNAEVKGPGGKYFDKTVKRGSSTGSDEEELIDSIAADLAAQRDIEAFSLEEYIDALREDPANRTRVGYIGDPEIEQRSGALPTAMFSAALNNDILDSIKSHWRHGGDTYFAVSNGTNTWLWYTGHGNNVLGAPEFDQSSMSGNISLSTYGTATAGRLRVALKSKFNLGSALKL